MPAKMRQGCVDTRLTQQNRTLFHCSVFPSPQKKSAALLLYGKRCGLSSFFGGGRTKFRPRVCRKEKPPTEADGGNFRKGVDNAEKMWYDKSTREHRRRLLPSAMVKDNRSELEAEGGYLFLCCAMYSNRRFRAKTIATNPSCRFMSITSFLSEGEKDLLPPKFGRKQPPPAGSACTQQNPPGTNAFCLASVATKR